MATVPVRVLIVEDFEPFQRFLVRLLESHSEVEIVGCAANGHEAVEKALNLEPDLILLDMSLPGLNGLEVAREIRTGSSHPKVLFVTQESSVRMVEAALANEGSGYLLKMDAARDLWNGILAVLHGRRFVSRRLVENEAPIEFAHPGKKIEPRK